MKVLGIDHGTRTGFAVMVDGKYIETGNFSIRTRGNHNNMLLNFYEECLNVMENVQPDVVSCEYPSDMQNAETARLLVGYYTIVKIIAMQLGIKICEVRPMTLKKVVAGKGNATKEEVCSALCYKLNVERNKIEIPVYYGDRIKKYRGKVRNYIYDESDALALAYYYFLIGHLTV